MANNTTAQAGQEIVKTAGQQAGEGLLQMQIIGGYALLDFLIVGGLGLAGFLLYVFLTDKEKQKTFNAVLGKAVDSVGAGKDKILEEEEMRDKLTSAVKKQKDKEEADREVEITVDQVMQELEAIQSQSKHLGKEEEQMKGEDSDDLYNIAVVSMLGVVALNLLFIYVHFM